MFFDYRKIFRQAYDITWNNKFLWIFGLFLVLGSVYYGFNISDKAQIEIPASLSIAIFIASIIFLYIYFRMRAGLIIGIKAILDKDPTSLGKCFIASRFFFSRILSIYLIINFGLLFLGILLAPPIMYLFTHNFHNRAIVLLVFALLIAIPVVIISLLITVIAPLFVIIFDFQIKEAISRSYELIRKFLSKLVGLGFLLILLQIGAMLIFGPIVFLPKLPYYMDVALMIIFGIVSLVFQAVVAVFIQAVWVIVFLQLVRPQKLDEEEVVPMPEVAS